MRKNIINEKKCIHMKQDGCGTYCGLKPMPDLSLSTWKEYPHKYWRTDCYGRKDWCKFKNLYQETVE